MSGQRIVVSRESRASTAVTLTVGDTTETNVYGDRLHTTFAPVSTSTLEAARPPNGACRLSLTDASVLAKSSNVPDPLNGLTTRTDALVYLGDYTLSTLSKRAVDSKDNTSYLDGNGEKWQLNAAPPATGTDEALNLDGHQSIWVPPGHAVVPVYELSDNGEDSVSTILLDLAEPSGSLGSDKVTPTFFTLKPGLYQTMADVTAGMHENLRGQYKQFHRSQSPLAVLARPQVRFTPTESGRMSMHLLPPTSPHPAFREKNSQTIYLNPAVWSVSNMKRSMHAKVGLTLAHMLRSKYVFWNPVSTSGEHPTFVLTYRFYNHAGFTSRDPALPTKSLGIHRAVRKERVVVQTYVIGISGSSSSMLLDAADVPNARPMVSADGLCTALCLSLPHSHTGRVQTPNFTILKTNDVVSVDAHYKLDGQDLAEQSYLTGRILRYSALSGHLVNSGTLTDIYPSAGSLRPLSAEEKASHEKVFHLTQQLQPPTEKLPFQTGRHLF